MASTSDSSLPGTIRINRQRQVSTARIFSRQKAPIKELNLIGLRGIQESSISSQAHRLNVHQETAQVHFMRRSFILSSTRVAAVVSNPCPASGDKDTFHAVSAAHVARGFTTHRLVGAWWHTSHWNGQLGEWNRSQSHTRLGSAGLG